jgi:hypothetical protein
MLPRRSNEDFDEHIFRSIEDLVARAVAAGKDPENALEAASKAMVAAIGDQAPKVAQSLRRRAPRMLREHRRIARRFERQLRRDWKSALDRYYGILVCATETGEDFGYRNEAQAREAGDLVYEALVGLHARACRVAGEVHTLLSSGFPYGARARCRTLHELAVTAFVIADYGRDPKHSDLAERFFRHDAVMRYREAVAFQERAEQLGYEPFGEEEITAWRAEHDQAIEQYGKSFRADYGWAANLLPDPRFRELEKSVNMSHLRAHYSWASNEVHSGIRGWVQNHVEWRGSLLRMSGRTNDGLADPGQMAAGSLYQVTVALITGGSSDGPGPKDILSLNTINILFEECCASFVAAQERLDAAEERVVGRKTTPEDGQ